MEKYQNKYRIPSARAQWWDYGWNGAYFITICTLGRRHYFGHVQNGTMQCSPIGQAAGQCWQAIQEHFPFVRLGASVVMPNHVHGIIIIDKPDGGHGDGDGVVETQNFASLRQSQQPPNTPKNKFGPQSKNLASIVRGYKIGVTKMAKAINPEFAWQPRYHDHIIRGDKEYQRISGYIMANPAKWENDKFFSM